MVIEISSENCYKMGKKLAIFYNLLLCFWLEPLEFFFAIFEYILQSFNYPQNF